MEIDLDSLSLRARQMLCSHSFVKAEIIAFKDKDGVKYYIHRCSKCDKKQVKRDE